MEKHQKVSTPRWDRCRFVAKASIQWVFMGRCPLSFD
jgi:hypothetical protein